MAGGGGVYRGGHDQAEPAGLCLVHALDEIGQRPVAGIDPVVVRDVVAVVAAGSRLKGREPQGVDAQALEVVEAAAEPLEVAAAVAVAVEEGLDVEAVEDGVLV